MELETAITCDIVNYHSDRGVTNVWWNETAEPLLTRSVPQLQPNLDTTDKNNINAFSYLRTPTMWHYLYSPAATTATDQYLLLAGLTAANLQQLMDRHHAIS